MFCDVDAERTAAVVFVINNKRKPALKGIAFKTHEMMVKADILGLTQDLKARFNAFEGLRAMHFPNEVFDLLSVLVSHTIPLSFSNIIDLSNEIKRQRLAAAFCGF